MTQPPLLIETMALKAMGCHIQVHVDMTAAQQGYSELQIGQELLQLRQDVEQALAGWEKIFSRFEDTSELMRLNRRSSAISNLNSKSYATDLLSKPLAGPGLLSDNQWFTVSADLYEVLQLAVIFASKTQGLVTPTLLETLGNLGYNRSFETLVTALPFKGIAVDEVVDTIINGDAQQGIETTKMGQQAAENIQFRTLANGAYQVRLPAGMTLDLNGYVKGWCADQLAQKISHQHPWRLPCLVDLGGDIAVGVPSSDDTISPAGMPPNWGVAIAKPTALEPVDKALTHHHKSDDVAIVQISSGGIATSGQDYRRWWHQGKWHHHLIDPRTHSSARSEVLSATIIADTTLEAEIWAKYCVLISKAAALSWLNHNNVAGLIVDTHDQVAVSHKMTAFIKLPLS